jgi:hypothetical protein
MRPKFFACTSKVMLKSSITRPGAAMSMRLSTSVRYMDANPGTIVTTLAQRAACPYLTSSCVTA